MTSNRASPVARGRASQIFVYTVLTMVAFVCLIPFYVLVLISFRDLPDMFSTYWPTNLTLQPYRDLFSTNRDIPVAGQVVLNFTVPFSRTILNSVFVSLVSTVLTVALCALAGFAFAKYRFPGRNLLFAVVLLTMLVPPATTIIPLFYVMVQIGWVDTYQGVLAPGLANAFGVFWMRQYMQSLPNELLDAGRTDGCSSLGVFWYIVLPLIKPGLSALGIFLFVTSWTDFLWPLIVLRSEALYTIPVFLAATNGPISQPAPLVMAGSVIATIPVIVVFLLFQRQFVSGIITGALK